MTVSAVAAAEIADHRPMLFGLAYRMLGSVHDAEDVLQDAYLRWSAIDRDTVAEPRRYLTRVVTRLAVDRLRARQSRRETYVGHWLPEPLPTGPSAAERVEQDDLVSMALLHMMERLSPPQRAVHVLREAFDVPYAEIAETLELSPEHCRQLNRRAAAALAKDRARFVVDPSGHRRILEAFVAAARDADLAGLARVLHADVTTWSDGGGRAKAARNAVCGADKVARFFAGIYGRPAEVSVEPLELNGAPGLVIRTPGGVQALSCLIVDDRIVAAYLVVNPDKLAAVTGAIPTAPTARR